ncbi:MAG: tRNA pseudouridine(55) synthase TruB [Proteobacteria bacterium]|nr:tRNA pseudouridine(55) synthase TruB [Pseudomonadota bacterium]
MAKKSAGVPVHGWLAIDKPGGITAAKVVSRVKRALNALKAGHGGTLDPLATGILPIALGEATKTASFAMDSSKTYTFEVTWGTATDTDDSDGTVIRTSDKRPEQAAIEAMLPRFTGLIAQVPPDYSAIKVNGQRAYDLARAKEELNLAARTVDVRRFALTSMPDPEHATFVVDCGKGTYIRALVRDLAQALGTEGHISVLRRTRCGAFNEKGAISLENLEALGHKAAASEYLLPVKTVLDDIPALALTEEEARRMSLGQAIALWPVVKRKPLTGLEEGQTVQAVCGERLIAVAEVGNGMVRPVRVLNH